MQSNRIEGEGCGGIRIRRSKSTSLSRSDEAMGSKEPTTITSLTQNIFLLYSKYLSLYPHISKEFLFSSENFTEIHTGQSAKNRCPFPTVMLQYNPYIYGSKPTQKRVWKDGGPDVFSEVVSFIYNQEAASMESQQHEI